MNNIDINDKNSLKNAVKVLNFGGILVFPTDTVYGIGCGLNKAAIRKMYKIKNRSNDQPTAVLMNEKVFAAALKRKIELEDRIAADFYAGKMTIIFPINSFNIEFPKALIARDETIGIRLPRHQWLSDLISQAGPITASSANKKGEHPPVNFADISEQIIKEADLVIRSDEKITGTPSKIYHLELKQYFR